MDGNTRGSILPRLTAEFVVIVVGVLVALGVDSCASSRQDRALEAEYLSRLLDDVRYDLAELTFVDSISKLGEAASHRLTSLETLDTLSDSRLVAAVFVAGNFRRADPSRSTFQELIYSGQIELIRSMEVRRALAAYNRTINELEDAWDRVITDWRGWSWARIPTDVLDRFIAECTASEGMDIHNFQTICEFDLGGWAIGSLRGQVRSQEAQRLLRRSEYGHGALSFFASSLANEARSLEGVLERELSRQ